MNFRYKTIINICVHIFAGIGFVLTGGYLLVRYGFTNTEGIVDKQRYSLQSTGTSTQVDIPNTSTSSIQQGWQKSEEWKSLSRALTKDVDMVNRVSKETGVSSRLIVSVVIVEQLRLFTSEREIFKTIFAPLNILGSQSQFSWGIAGIKRDTAEQVELHLVDKTSPYYLGPEYEHMLDFNTKDIEQERFTRITDEHNHYYSYLYAALYIKQIQHQWNTAGFNIDMNGGVLATLYNIGFTHSIPHANPQVGGASITVGGDTYSFGGLAQKFYDSEELSVFRK
jgi:hypothetical protein